MRALQHFVMRVPFRKSDDKRNMLHIKADGLFAGRIPHR